MIKTVLFAASVLAFGGAIDANASALYSQAWDASGNLYTSQNDTTPGGFGNFATTYDDFTLTGAGASLNEVDFVGGYFNPAAQGPISAFTLTLYGDNAGIPGGALAAGVFSGTGNETYLGSPGGFPTYSYH